MPFLLLANKEEANKAHQTNQTRAGAHKEEELLTGQNTDRNNCDSYLEECHRHG